MAEPIPSLTFRHGGFTYHLRVFFEGPGEIQRFEVSTVRDETKDSLEQFIGKNTFVKSKPVWLFCCRTPREPIYAPRGESGLW